jgi:DNA-binding MarR family transcriptional regulator
MAPLSIPLMDHPAPGARGATTTTDLPDVLQFMQLLWAVVHGLERQSKRMHAAIGVTGPQRLVLRVAGLLPGLSAGDLARILHVHPSTLTGVLRRLVTQQLLQRVDNPRDRRRAILWLTKRGTRANRVREGTVESAIAEALKGISPRNRAATKRVLQRLADHLKPNDLASAREMKRARPTTR